jgi:hypothetical protein
MKRPRSGTTVFGLIQLALVMGAFFSAALGSPGLARADRAYLFPMERRAGEQTLTPEVIAEAHDGVRSGLQTADVTVVEEALLEGELATCSVDRCAERIAATLGVEYSVYVAIWPAQEGHQPEIIVGVASAQNGTYVADCRVGADDDYPCARTTYAEAARLATERAVAKYLRGPGPWLVVEGSPQNAKVLIDGTEVGRVPDRFRVEPGDHEVTLELEGYESQTHTVTVEPGPSSEAELEVELSPGGRSPLWTTLAIASWVGAATLSGIAIGTLASGTTVERFGAFGLEERGPDGVAAGAMFGGAVIAAGLGLLIWILDTPGDPPAATASNPFAFTF